MVYGSFIVCGQLHIGSIEFVSRVLCGVWIFQFVCVDNVFTYNFLFIVCTVLQSSVVCVCFLGCVLLGL
jgi:hypothetical protein